MKKRRGLMIDHGCTGVVAGVTACVNGDAPRLLTDLDVLMCTRFDRTGARSALLRVRPTDTTSAWLTVDDGKLTAATVEVETPAGPVAVNVRAAGWTVCTYTGTDGVCTQVPIAYWAASEDHPRGVEDGALTGGALLNGGDLLVVLKELANAARQRGDRAADALRAVLHDLDAASLLTAVADHAYTGAPVAFDESRG